VGSCDPDLFLALIVYKDLFMISNP
jgi:hypothetical protein